MAKNPLVVLCCWTVLAFATTPLAQAETVQANEIVHRLLVANEVFVKASGPEHFKPFMTGQHPMATVLSCSDSRVQMEDIDASPDNELFVIRNIGNQLATGEGSVEYGVHHLHTPVLLIIGHVRCGAIQAALGDYSKESPAIKRELVTLKVSKGGDWLEGVKANLNDQVKAALVKFGPEVKEGSLTVVGAIYDFADDLHQGNGRLVVMSVNGETAPEKIKAFLGERTGEKK
jgi:carbonic anhydrase